MNPYTFECLEYSKIKSQVIEQTVTFLGKQHAEAMQPMTVLSQIRHALKETEEALHVLNHGASVPIPTLTGLEQLLQLLGTGYVFSENDFTCLYTFLRGCQQLKKYMAGKMALAPGISAYASSFFDASELELEIDRCIRNGLITDTASKELSKLRRQIAKLDEAVRKRLDALLGKHRSILQDAVVGMRNGRYVLPVKKEHRKRVQGTVLDESSSGQTVFIEPAEIASFQHQLSLLRMDESREEMKILSELTALAEAYAYEIKVNMDAVGTYDYIFARAKYARTIDGRNVDLNEEGRIQLEQAIHPLLSSTMVPLHFSIGDDYRCLIITGPNTGGKTVALKTVGLLTLMAQSGLLVPVGSGSTLSIFERICVDIGDGQSLEQSLSTFSAHIRNLVDVLRQADERTLVLIDEMASGTDPGEGVGLSIAVLERLRQQQATVVVTTHYNEIKEFARLTPGFENARMEFDAESLQPLYRLTVGEAGQSYALFIAQRLGMDPAVIARSKELTGKRIKTGEVNLFKQLDSFQSIVPRRKKVAKSDIDSIQPEEQNVRPLQVGDAVYIGYLDKTGIIYELEDERGNLGVLVQKERLRINRKRLKLNIGKEMLYPGDYDMDIVFESKENRKKRKLMGKRHVDGNEIIIHEENRREGKSE